MAIRNSAAAFGNPLLNCDTPPNSQSVIPSTSSPSRRACQASPFVEQDRDEEQERRDDRHREMRAAGEPRVLGREDSVGECPDDQRKDDEPAPADPHLNAADAAERDVAVHECICGFQPATNRRPVVNPEIRWVGRPSCDLS
jgi:hypothetical protein